MTAMKGFGQFCPVAKATEVLGERWTPLIIRELLCDDQSFNSLRKGVPLMSPSLLSSRLKSLEAAGVVDRICSGKSVTYTLTEAGEELRPIVEQLGVWGQRWARSDMSKADLDPGLLMWDMHRNINASYFKAARTVLRFEYFDFPPSQRLYWLVVEDDDVDICVKDPGHDVDLFVRSPLATMTHIWMGDMSIASARRRHGLELSGNTAIKRDMEKWIGRSTLAGIPPAE